MPRNFLGLFYASIEIYVLHIVIGVSVKYKQGCQVREKVSENDKVSEISLFLESQRKVREKIIFLVEDFKESQ